MGKGIVRIYKHIQRNWPYSSPNTIYYYQNIMTLLLKPNKLVLVMTLWVNMPYLILYHIKELAIVLIPMSTIMMIHIHLKHTGKIITVLPLLKIKSPQKPHHIHPQLLWLENIIFVLKYKEKFSENNNVLN